MERGANAPGANEPPSPVEPGSGASLLSRLAPELEARCRAYLGAHRARLVDVLAREPGSGLGVAEAHARALEGLLGSLFAAARAALEATGARPGSVALVAVGGLGRRELGLFSDLDVVLVTDASGSRDVSLLAEALFYTLWNVGLDVGHSVRSVEELGALAREDLRTATMLLDVRRIAGDPALVEGLERAAASTLVDLGGEIVDRLAQERSERHARFGGSPFLLEPDVKQGCGGLRDLDIARWTSALRWGARAAGDAVRLGVLGADEERELAQAQAFVWDVRQRLHVRAGRRQDRLTFEDQEELARELGLVDDPSGLLGVERFMQSYYRHTRAAERICDRLLTRARAEATTAPEPREPVGPGLVRLGERVALESPGALARDPAVALALYREAVERALAPDPASRDAITRFLSAPEAAAALRASEAARAAFLDVLAWIGEVPVRRGSVLGELHDVGLLLAMIPEFEPVTGRVQHDVYHLYTVDVHSIAAVDRLRALLRGELADELAVATRVATEVVHRQRLALAVLLHDVGKGRGADHSVQGAALARPIAARLGLEPADVAHVEWLVLEHLHLYRWAMRRDTSDPDTLAEIARAIGTPDRLRDLFLLTLVDLATTNPSALSSWKARLFDDLYLDLAKILEGEVAEPARVALSSALDQAGAIEARRFLDTMPDRYATSATAETVVSHAAIVGARGDRLVHVALRDPGTPEVAELVVVADDRPGLLADIAAVLAAGRLAVVTASIHTRRTEDGRTEAVDVFDVRSPAGAEGPAVDASRLARLEAELARVIRGEVHGAALLSGRPPAPAWARRRGPEVRTEIVVDNAASPAFTVVDVFTRDREGLLHAIARALHDEGLSIALAKISTEGERVTDAFYVADAAGRKVEQPGRVASLRDALRRAVAARSPSD
jgi:[protein-PII] uridylyltransferase